jgi:hypothetical protein
MILSACSKRLFSPGDVSQSNSVRAHRSGMRVRYSEAANADRTSSRALVLNDHHARPVRVSDGHGVRRVARLPQNRAARLALSGSIREVTSSKGLEHDQAPSPEWTAAGSDVDLRRFPNANARRSAFE